MRGRVVISGTIFVIHNGLRWRDAPKDYGPHKTIYNNNTSAWPQFGLQKKDIRPLGEALSAANHEPTFFGGLRTRFRGE